ncbi:TraR/DksA C4-type zinc finger protein [Marinobacterium sp. AK62]|uniref:TraR/DksA C4-type zinc finger protein n=1 Tax=Marinobacterium alkalitolerans TaxID=1542925 RepID=A0ABS3ZED2_9GAMM|nr:TraR/DksA C4-type zinc finger protein [Marinobacterium alkalitolerans]MBP0049648.1 TraR/DksA C4-type zinc finger protein [Marinobacterium alkalitolerans]
MSAVMSQDELQGIAEELHELLDTLHEELGEELKKIEHARHLLRQVPEGKTERQSALELARRLELEHLRQHLDTIAACNEALERINRGHYGRCVECGEAIELNLLRADPLISTCMACQG